MTYQELLMKLNALSLAIVTMNYDIQTIAPKEGAEYRNELLSILNGDYFNLLTSEETKTILEKTLKSEKEIERIGATILLRDFNKQKNIPHNEYVAYQKLTSDAFIKWEEARSTNEYALFEPYLENIIKTHKRFVSLRKEPGSLYESCLDDFEEGLTEEAVTGFLNAVEKELIPLLNQILNKQNDKPAFLSAFVSVEKQRLISTLIMNHLGYSSAFGYLGEAAHPFSSTFSINDTRITTHYHEDNFTSSIFSIIHEIGHSMYNHQVNPLYEGTPLADSMSFSLHESQSRLLENIVGRSPAFWEPIYPQLQALIPDVLGNISLDDFILGINFVEKGVIRTEADEVTYSLHILVRTLFEQTIINNDHLPSNLNHVYDDIFEKVMGARPKNDQEGILQDVHWSDGSFGYFPTYALGSAYAAQFMHRMRQDLDVDTLLRNGHIDQIFNWLQLNVHQYGGAMKTQDVILKATGEPFNPQYYIDYLKNKYTQLLNI